jgi:hypothetical protein
MAAVRDEAKRLGEHGLQGWRAKVADTTAPHLARVAPVDEHDLRAWIGLAFVVLSAWYVGAVVARFVRSR